MNEVHVHLMLNHLPVVGSFFAVMLLASAVWRRSDELIKVAFGAFVLIAVVTVPTYKTGDAAQMMVDDLPGVTMEAIRHHESAAQISGSCVMVVGLMALIGLILFRKKPASMKFAFLVLALSLVAAGTLAWTANLGGQVRHTEIRNEITPKAEIG